MKLPVLALRNVFRNKRRSLVTILAIAVGLLAVNLFGGYTADVYKSLKIQAVAGERLGHLTVLKEGMLTLGKLKPELYMFNSEEATELADALSEIDSVRMVTPRLSISGMATNGRASTIFIGEALVAEDLTVLREDLVSGGGTLDAKQETGVAVSSGLALLFGLEKGDILTLLTSTLRGQANALDSTIIDVFDTGNINTNDKYLVTTMPMASRLLDTGNVERFVVLLHDIADTESARTDIERVLETRGLKVEIRTWEELSSFYTQVKGLFDMIFTFIAAIVFIVAAMSIANSMAMTVIERTREIGTLRAMGMRQSKVIALFVFEAIWLGAIGVAVGVASSYLIAFGVNDAGIEYIPPNSSMAVPLLIDLQSGALAIFGLLVICLALLAAALPAWRAARQDIVDALAFN